LAILFILVGHDVVWIIQKKTEEFTSEMLMVILENSQAVSGRQKSATPLTRRGERGVVHAQLPENY